MRRMGRVQLERGFALLMVVLCGLCYAWVQQGVRQLDRVHGERSAKLVELGRLRSALADKAPQDLAGLDGLFPGLCVSVQRTEAGPMLVVTPQVSRGEG